MAEWMAVHPYWTVAIALLLVYFIANMVLFWAMVVQDKMLEGATIREKIVALTFILLFASPCAICAVVFDKFLSEKDDKDDLENQE